MKEIKTTPKISTSEFTIQLREDGIIHLYLHDQIEISKNTLIELSENIKKLVGDKAAPLIVEAGEFVEVTKEAKEFANEYESEIPIISRAIVTKNLAQKIIAHYYYKNRKVSSPVKEFDTIEDGIKWLKDLKEEQF